MNLSKIKILIILLFLIALPMQVFAVSDVKVKNDYPRLANHYLKWGINKREAKELYKWDLLILDVECQEISKNELRTIKDLNPEIIILPYISPQEIVYDIQYPEYAKVRTELLDNIDRNNWWLVDENGNRTSFWGGTYLINLTDGADWNEFLPRYVNDKILSTGYWDGVFYDSLIGSTPYTHGAKVDINYDGRADTKEYTDRKWREGVSQMLAETRKIVGDDVIIVANSADYMGYQQYLNGRTYETFPTPWEGDGSWAATMKPYLTILPKINHKPLIYTINSNTENTGKKDDYREMRFGLTSTLLGEGYFSFDYGDTSHAQTWWYDEYNIALGKAQSKAYNLLDKNNSTIKPGLWRRDFENGVAIVNSTNSAQTYVFQKEEFEKINGIQDRSVNNGTKVNWVKLQPNDGVILMKINNEIRNDSFNNGSFVRVFNLEGNQIRNGFFAYKSNYPGNTQILVSDIDDDNEDEILVNGNGIISIYKNSRMITSFQPYEGRFKGDVSFAVEDLNGDGTKEIITGAGQGGGPHVRVFSKDGRPLIGGFFAYDKNFRGGVNVAVIDLNGDGTKEIITGAGQGGGPHVRVFSKDGKALTGGFFAYDKGFSGGVSVAVGDVNADGIKEIITGPGPGASPYVKIFSKDGNFIKEFLTYDYDMKSGIQVISDDINKDDIADILVSTISF